MDAGICQHFLNKSLEPILYGMDPLYDGHSHQRHGVPADCRRPCRQCVRLCLIKLKVMGGRLVVPLLCFHLIYVFLSLAPQGPAPYLPR